MDTHGAPHGRYRPLAHADGQSNSPVPNAHPAPDSSHTVGAMLGAPRSVFGAARAESGAPSATTASPAPASMLATRVTRGA